MCRKKPLAGVHQRQWRGHLLPQGPAGGAGSAAPGRLPLRGDRRVHRTASGQPRHPGGPVPGDLYQCGSGGGSEGAAGAGDQVVLLRSQQGTEVLPQLLARWGYEVRELSLYSLRGERTWDEKHPLDYLLFASAGGVEAFFVGGDVAEGTVCVCIGPVTARALAGPRPSDFSDGGGDLRGGTCAGNPAPPRRRGTGRGGTYQRTGAEGFPDRDPRK